jgi:hypothetical protein
MSIVYPERTIIALYAIGTLAILGGLSLIISVTATVVGLTLIAIGVVSLVYAIQITRKVRESGEHL